MRFSKAFRPNDLRSLTLILILVGCLIVLLGTLRVIRIKSEIDVIALLGFAVVIFQLAQNLETNRTTFLTNYLARIYTDQDLSSAFHDLVETYTDDIFEKVVEVAIEKKADEVRKEKGSPVFDIFDGLQGPRLNKPGQRYYHPDYFQGSEEERKLDALIGFLNIVGYHYYYGLIKMKDLAAMLNYQLAALAGRQVVKTYLQMTGRNWWSTSASISRSSPGAPLPYLYFRNMLGDYLDYVKKSSDFLKKEEEKIADRMQGKFL